MGLSYFTVGRGIYQIDDCYWLYANRFQHSGGDSFYAVEASNKAVADLESQQGRLLHYSLCYHDDTDEEFLSEEYISSQKYKRFIPMGWTRLTLQELPLLQLE